MKKRFRLSGSATALLTMLLLALPAFGQAPTTGSIFGKVADESGASLPGVTATLSGVGAPQTTTTDTRGEFHFLQLSPGIYSVSCALQGFSTVDRANVSVTLGRNTDLTITMKLSSVTATVTVTGETPLLDTRKQEAGHVFTQKELSMIPTARDPWVILQQSPSVLVDRVNVGGSQSGQQSTFVGKGTDSSQNSFNVDGVTITDMAATGSSPTYYDFDAFQEMQVTTGGSDPSIVVPGVTLNMVTKRGTNQVHGSGRLFVTNQRYQARNIPAEAAAQGITKSNAISGVRDYGIEVGGPIVPDKVWAWGSYGRNQIDLLQVGGTTDRTTLENAAIKLNGQVIPSNSATLFYFRGDKIKIGRNSGPTRPQPTSWDQGGPTSIYKIEDSQVIGSSVVLDAAYSYVDGGFFLTPEGGLNVDFYRDPKGVWQRSFFDYKTKRPQRQVNATGSYFFNTGQLGHELKFGFGYRKNDTASHSAATGTGNYGLEFGTPPPVTGLAVLRRDNNTSETARYYSGYLLDTLTFSNLTVNAGVRYDYQWSRNLPQVIGANKTFPELMPAINYPGSAKDFTWKNWEPRVGVTYALGAQKTTLARASYARYADQLGAAASSFTSPLGYAYLYYYWNDKNGNHTIDRGELGDFYGAYNMDPNNPGAVSSPNKFNPKFKAATTDEFTVGADQQILPELVAGVTYTYRKRRDIQWSPLIGVTGKNYSLLSNGVTGYDRNGNPVGMTGPIYTYTGGYTGNFGKIQTNRPDFNTTYNGVELQLTKRLSNRWMAHASFTYADWKQKVGNPATACINPTNALTGSGASCASDIAFANSGTGSGAFGNVYINAKWQFNVAGLYQLPWGFNFGANFYGRQGYPIPYFRRVNAKDKLGTTRVLIGKADDQRNASVYQLDLRAEKAIPLFSGAGNLILSLDLFNALNKGTILQRRSDTTPIGCAPTNLTCTGKSVAGQIVEIQSPRVLRFGARFTF